jgi:hypothetical protein
MNTWKVTLKTGPNKWSTITVDCQTHYEAIAKAKRLLGNFPVTNII